MLGGAESPVATSLDPPRFLRSATSFSMPAVLISSMVRALRLASDGGVMQLSRKVLPILVTSTGGRLMARVWQVDMGLIRANDRCENML